MYVHQLENLTCTLKGREDFLDDCKSDFYEGGYNYYIEECNKWSDESLIKRGVVIKYNPIIFVENKIIKNKLITHIKNKPYRKTKRIHKFNVYIKKYYPSVYPKTYKHFSEKPINKR